MKNKRGITLIALIITIIVLLILASVSISIVVGDNGVLTQAQKAKLETEQADMEEKRQLTIASAAMNLEGYIFEEKVEDSNKILKAYIPSGFEVSQIDGENKISKGLVVIDKYGDEFVWIPVDSENEFNRKESSSFEINSYGNRDRRLNGVIDKYSEDSKLTANIEKDLVIKGKGFYVSRYEIGIKSMVRNEDMDYYTEWSEARNDSNTSKQVIDKLLLELNSKKGMEPMRCISQDECLALANNWKVGKDYQSCLITGRTWDRMISFICDDDDINNFDDMEKNGIKGELFDCTNWGNYQNSLSVNYQNIFSSSASGKDWKLNKQNNGWAKDGIGENYRYVFPTGEFINEKGNNTAKKNVYDVAGNLREWTTEVPANNSSNRISRGGCAANNGYDEPASRRHGYRDGNDWADPYVGFRCVIYVYDSENF